MASRKKDKDQKAEMKPTVGYGQGLSYGTPKPREKKPPGSRPAFLSQEPAKKGRPMRDPNAIKNMMMEWCSKMTEGYEHVDIKDFNNSWYDGMALCALIHHFFPDEFNYNALDPDNRKENFSTAFAAAKKLLGVDPIVEAEEIAKMATLDWKVTYTYIQYLYRSLCQKKLCTPMKPPEPTAQ